MIPIHTIIVFLNKMFTVFLDRVSPDSSVAKPRCMMKTSIPANMIHRLLVTKPSVCSIADTVAAGVSSVSGSAASSVAGTSADSVASVASCAKIGEASKFETAIHPKIANSRTQNLLRDNVVTCNSSGSMLMVVKVWLRASKQPSLEATAVPKNATAVPKLSSLCTKSLGLSQKRVFPW